MTHCVVEVLKKYISVNCSVLMGRLDINDPELGQETN